MNLANLNWPRCIAAEREAMAKSWFPDTNADAGQVIYSDKRSDTRSETLSNEFYFASNLFYIRVYWYKL
jgi:hypothetical protein